MNFVELKQLVSDYLNRSDLSHRVGDFINIAMRKLEQQYDFRHMERKQAVANHSLPYITLPELYKNTIALFVTINGKRKLLKHESLQKLLANELPDGIPEIFATEIAENRLILNPNPSTLFSYELYYRAYTPFLVNDDDSNYLTDNAYWLLVYGACLEATPYLVEDARVAIWGEMLKSAIASLLTRDIKEQFSGSVQTLKSGYI